MKKINVLLFGLGNIGYKYDLNTNYIQTHFKAILKNKNYNLIGVIDNDRGLIKKFRKLHIIPAYTTLNKNILHCVDLIVLAVPTDKQFIILQKILKLGYKKNFILEKPFIKSLTKINSICKIKRQKFFINYYRNYDDNLISFLKKIKKYTKLKIYINYSKGFYHNCSHYLNLFIKIFGNIQSIKFSKIKKIKNDLKLNGSAKFKKCTINFYNISNKFTSNFHILKDGKKIFSYKNDGLKILNKIKKNRLKPNYDYMNNVYTNIYKNLNKTKSNFYDINSHKLLLENLAKFI